MDTTVADPLIGALLDGRYRIGGLVARGGMATVYRAIDERLERPVAIKIIRPGQAGREQFTERFEREAKAVARIAHPNVVGVYDQGRHDGLPYLVMEYVPGRTLRDLLTERRRFSPAEALDVLVPILAALSAAHRAGLVHRDVKPENVLLADDAAADEATVKVADFGLARAVEASVDEHAGGQLLATVGYVAPELVTHGRADPRTDVYAAGVLLFELLTGRVPFTGDNPVDVAWQHVEHDVPPPSSLRPGLPPQVDDLVLRATRRDPGARPTDAGALLAELRAAREDLGLGARGVAEVERDTVEIPHTRPLPVRRPRRRRRLVAFLVVVVVALALAVAGWWLGAGRYAAAPNLLALSQVPAEAAVRHAGFRVAEVGGYSETAPVGVVIGQRPAPGDRLPRGGTVTLVLSRGPERYAVPNLVGADFDTAAGQLRQLPLNPVLAQQYSQSVPAGHVVAVSPAPGTELKRNADVTLTVSKGPPPVVVPNEVGRSVDDAKSDLADSNLTVRTTQQASDNVPKGRVIAQDPPAGSGAERGAVVSLTVSSGPPLVTVPDVTGKSYDDAKRALAAAGLDASRVLDLLGGSHTVRIQSPNAGEQVPKGSTVSLWLF